MALVKVRAKKPPEAFGDFNTSTADVEAPSSLGDVLPVAETVAPPPELLEKVHKLEEAQEQIPKATPLNTNRGTEENLEAAMFDWCISVVIVAAIIAIVLGVVLGTNNDNENDDNTESPTFILLKDMVTSVWPDSSDVRFGSIITAVCSVEMAGGKCIPRRLS